MAARRALLTLRADQLRHAATCLGLATSGKKKATLESTITQSLSEHRSFSKAPVIVSVDMGIKNLGLCVLQAPGLARESKGRKQFTAPSPIQILAWKKFNVLGQLQPADMTETSVKVGGKRPAKAKVDPSVFRPALLSKVALEVAQDILQTYKPTHILIERQRFRTMGGSAVQEWTLRVNMLESMLYACFETLSSTSTTKQPFPEVVEVSPARVARFWCGGTSQDEGTDVETPLAEIGSKPSQAPKRKKKNTLKLDKVAKKDMIDKRARINVVRSWLAADEVPLRPQLAVDLEFTEQAREVAETFKVDPSTGKRVRGEAAIASVDGPVKLDDLADCLLQGVAWVRWEENRRKLADIMSRVEQEAGDDA